MPRINVIEPENAEGQLKEIYEGLEKSRGKIAEVHKIQSLNPKSIVNHMDLYLTIMFGNSPLKRYQREMMAVVVSMANQCKYCENHHLEALKNYWKDQERIAQFLDDYQKANLSGIDKLLCDYANSLTLHPEYQNRSTCIDRLKAQKLSDRAILDATLVISYFNFVNRIVLALDVNLEKDPGGYNY